MTPTPFEEQYKCIPFLAMLYIAFALAVTILVNRLIVTPVGIISALFFVSPLWFMLGNVIAEVYGCKTSMKLFWSTAVCQFIAGLICHFLLNLQSPASWHGQASYDYVLGKFLSNVIFQIVALLIAWRINAFLITKWKIWWKGRVFWLRYIVAASISQAIFSVLIYPTFFWLITVHTFKDATHLLLWGNVIQIAITIILSIPAFISVVVIKRIDKEDVYETVENFNPLRLL